MVTDLEVTTLLEILSNKSVGADSDTTPDDGGSFCKTVLVIFKLLLTEGWKESFD